ncbi:uncharacterized protein LOC105424679 isoform X1 [Pogonomyrmex barbatus]|uniref:Uncharacterized protein LOC105424679 isoform X1 n=2 Tax=Pogonomyrmex barbatus TaxID=144034 RepID=A0A6I9VY63_9HYME|nr:uncharacterized protein LOC105424679 isoform X1 [Pogonomyrmex barbatus]
MYSKVELNPPSIRQPKKNKLKTILIAIPNSVEFRNCESNKLYRKVIMLQNVSTSSARFQLVARPSSRFTIMIKSKGQTGNIPPGMYIKLIVFFRCDILNEPEEMLVINVQQGRSVIVTLRGYREPPLLRVISIPYSQYPSKNLQTMVRNMEIPFRQTNSCAEFTDISSNADISTENVTRYRKLKSFDCGKCLVGEQTTLPLKIKNVGSEGRFFIMSEIDWCSMHIEDVDNNNMLILPSFAMWPVHFTLKSQEYIYLYICFFPDADGMHVNHNSKRSIFYIFFLLDNFLFSSSHSDFFPFFFL